MIINYFIVHYHCCIKVSRQTLEVTVEVMEKEEKFIQASDGGLIKVKVEESLLKERALTDQEAQEIAALMIQLENKMGKPQDFEWAIEKGILKFYYYHLILSFLMSGQLYCLQARPVVTLPPSCFFDHSATGTKATLWDNSNIVESDSGVTTPLTFTFVSQAYEKVTVLYACPCLRNISILITRYTR